jgi:hypothetical protein
MGTGCSTVVRTHAPNLDVMTGVWSDGRVATIFGTRETSHTYDTIAFGTKKIAEAAPTSGYAIMAHTLLKFFQTGIVPVSHQETVEILTFMEAADESKRRGGVPISLAEVLAANGGADGI